MTISPGERLEAELTPDICILPDRGATRHFIRGHIQLPVVDSGSGAFVWSVWVELNEPSMTAVASSWSNLNRAAIPPLSGLLATELPYEQSTKGLPVDVHTRDLWQAPLLMLDDRSEHPLAVEQRHGIEIHRVAEFGALMQR